MLIEVHGTGQCSECGKYLKNSMIVELGQPVDYESQTAFLCERCVRKAYADMLAKLNGEKATPIVGGWR